MKEGPEMDFKNTTALVIGCGISGVAASKLLRHAGAKVYLFDGNAELDLVAVAEKFADDERPVLIKGDLPEEIKEEITIVVPSPGVPVDEGLPAEFAAKKIPLLGEIEMGYLFSKGQLIAITGTNGKTTTTALTGEIMKAHAGSVFVVGNIGNPYTLEAEKTTEDSFTVAEISSFQLETIDSFKPTVSAILNITPDHLNRHHTMDNYVAVKESIMKNQDAGSFCVLNYEDPYTRAFGESLHGVKPLFFSTARVLADGFWADEEAIFYAENGISIELMKIREMTLLGKHNVENVMAAMALTHSVGVPFETICRVVKTFKAVEHRIEYVATKKGVAYYNDSKGTNPDAAIKAVEAMPGPTILIGGGYDKQNTYDEWIESFGTKVKLLVLLGQTRDKIAECARAHGFTNIVMADSLEETVRICADHAVAGDYVLLSPACASWGMFPNYEVRGRMFKELVGKLED